jgi:hypothetical protein
MNRSPAGPMVYLPATAQVETNVTALALISPAPDAGWRPRFARMTCAHPLPAVDAAITACEREQSGRSRLWKLAIAAYPPYAEYQERTARRIPVFVAERS